LVKVRHQPLFNRRYLLILIWVLPIVILILHRSGQSGQTLDRIGRQGEQGYLLPLAGQAFYRLTLILPSGAALGDDDWVAEQAVERALRARLDEAGLRQWLAERQWQPELYRTGTYLALSLTLQEVPTPAQQQRLLERLAQPPELDWQALERRLRAERYLQARSAEERLLAAFGERPDAAVGIASAYSRLWQAPPRWTLSGDLDAGEDTAPPPAPRTGPAPALRTGEQRIPVDGSGRADTGWELIAQSIPAPTDGRTLARQRLAAELMSRLLARNTPPGSDYRWLWRPLVDGGYRGLLLHDWPGSPIALGERLARQLDQPLLDATRDALLEQLKQIEKEEPQRWLDLVALYRLPLDSHTAFRDTLVALDLEQARRLLVDTLPPAQSLHIRFDTAGH